MKVKRGRPKKEEDIERRIKIQKLVWEKGLSVEKAAAQLNLSACYCRQVAGARLCECGNPKKWGSSTCERCEVLESTADRIYGRTHSGVKEDDAKPVFIHREAMHRACMDFHTERGLPIERNSFNQWEGENHD